jgi:hypothetical protein
VHLALSATTETLVAFAQEQLALLVPFFADGTMEAVANDPQEMTTAGRQGVSLWLYRILRDDQRLNAPPRRIDATRLEPVPLPLRLYYLVTPVVGLDTANAPGTRQTILGGVLQAFHDHPSFRGADLRGALTGTTTELTVRLEPLPIDDLARVWDALDFSYQLSISYEVTVVYVRSARAPEVVRPVEVARPEWGLVTGVEPLDGG